MRGFCKDQRGTIAVLSALSATVLIGFGALAVDVANSGFVKSKLQNAADAAALAASQAPSHFGSIGAFSNGLLLL